MEENLNQIKKETPTKERRQKPTKEEKQDPRQIRERREQEEDKYNL